MNRFLNIDDRLDHLSTLTQFFLFGQFLFDLLALISQHLIDFLFKSIRKGRIPFASTNHNVGFHRCERIFQRGDRLIEPNLKEEKLKNL